MKVVDDPNVSGSLEELNALLIALTALRKGDAKVLRRDDRKKYADIAVGVLVFYWR